MKQEENASFRLKTLCLGQKNSEKNICFTQKKMFFQLKGEKIVFSTEGRKNNHFFLRKQKFTSEFFCPWHNVSTQKEHIFPKKQLLVCRKKSSTASFFKPGINFSPYRNIYSQLRLLHSDNDEGKSEGTLSCRCCMQYTGCLNHSLKLNIREKLKLTRSLYTHYVLRATSLSF